MNNLAKFLCLSLLIFTFSCEPDNLIEDKGSKIEGEWKVTSITGDMFTSVITSNNGSTNSSTGTFIGEDISMTVTFDADGTFTTTGNYQRILTITSSSDPFEVTSLANDLEGGGTWEVEDDILSLRTIADTEFQFAGINVLNDVIFNFDLTYSRNESGNVNTQLDVDVNYILEKQ